MSLTHSIISHRHYRKILRTILVNTVHTSMNIIRTEYIHTCVYNNILIQIKSGTITLMTFTSLLPTLFWRFVGRILPIWSLLYCQASKARLATYKLPQPRVNLIDFAATPATLRALKKCKLLNNVIGWSSTWSPWMLKMKWEGNFYQIKWISLDDVFLIFYFIMRSLIYHNFTVVYNF